MRQSPYRAARRVFWIVDNGSSHRGARLRPSASKRRSPISIPVHGPVHASWLNQIEIYFSIVQRKALTPNDFGSLADVEERLLGLPAVLREHRHAIRVAIHQRRPHGTDAEARLDAAALRRRRIAEYVAELMNRVLRHDTVVTGARARAAAQSRSKDLEARTGVALPPTMADQIRAQLEPIKGQSGECEASWYSLTSSRLSSGSRWIDCRRPYSASLLESTFLAQDEFSAQGE